MTKGKITPSEVDHVQEGMSAEQSKARARLLSLIDERGIKPITVEQLRAMGDAWPEDENVDDFITDVREWRRDGRTRSIR
jgi:hypothetical protein